MVVKSGIARRSRFSISTMAVVFILLVLLALVNLTYAAEINVEVKALEDFGSSGSVDNTEILIQEEAKVMNALTEVDTQLDTILQELPSNGSTKIDVVISEPLGSGSDQWIDDGILVVIPASNLTEEEKNELKEEIENEVAETLDQVILDELVELPKQVEQEFPGDLVESHFGSLSKVESLFEEEEQATEELNKMESDLEALLDYLPESGGSTEIDIIVSDADGGTEVVDEEIAVEIPAKTGSGPTLTTEEKNELEEEIVEEVADTLGAIFLNDFVGTAAPVAIESNRVASPHLEMDPLLESSPSEHTSPPLTIVEAVAEAVGEYVHPDLKTEVEPSGLRGAATVIAQPGFEHPMFIPHHWQMPPEDQLWTMKLSMLTSISCVTILLIMGVWTQIRRSRRRATIDDSHFRWAEAVEYMDAFPYDP